MDFEPYPTNVIEIVPVDNFANSLDFSTVKVGYLLLSVYVYFYLIQTYISVHIFQYCHSSVVAAVIDASK